MIIGYNSNKSKLPINKDLILAAVHNNVIDACKSRPLDLPTTRKVIRALIGKNSCKISRRERLIKAFKKDVSDSTESILSI